MAWALLLLVRLTTKSEVGATDTVTMPVAAFLPSPSEIVDWIERDRQRLRHVGVRHREGGRAHVYPDPAAEAVMVTLLAAVSAMPSSTALMANVRRSRAGRESSRSRLP